MKRYDAYKSTGIPWIPEVPKHWEVRMLSQLAKEHYKPNKDVHNQNLLSLSYGRIINKDINRQTGLTPASYDTYQIVENGNIVLRLTDLQNDQRSLRVGLCTQEGIITSAYLALEARESMHPPFLYLLLHVTDLMKVFYCMGNGLRQNLNWGELRKLLCILPPLSEQRAIVAYIERKERQIDAYIARQAEQIERLKELRQTIISHAVTRGIHPYTRFRPTGIPWIPEVPEHWKCVELKRVTVFNPSRKEYLDGDTLVGYAPMEIVRSNMESCLTIEVNKLTAGLTYFEEGDVVLAKVTPCFENGNVAIIPKMIHYCGFGSSELFVYRCNKDKLDPKQLFYYFQSTGFVSAGIASMTGTGGLKRISPTFARNAKIPLPPISEQRAIVAYIEKKTATVDRMINACHEQTELMKAYKQRLISDVVTGRINVLPHD